MNIPGLMRINLISLVIGVGLCCCLAACTPPASAPVLPTSQEDIVPPATFTPSLPPASTQLPTLIVPATQSPAPTPTSIALRGPGDHVSNFPFTYTIDQVKEGIERARLSQATASALRKEKQVQDRIFEGQSLLRSLGFSTDPAQGIYARAEMVPVVHLNADRTFSWWMAAVDVNGKLLGWLFIEDENNKLRAAKEPLTFLGNELSPEDAQIFPLNAAGMAETQTTWALITGQLILAALDEEGNPAQWFNPSAGKFEPLALQIRGNIHLLNAPMTQLEAYQLSASDCRFMDAFNACPLLDSDDSATIPETCGEIWNWSNSLLDHTAEMSKVPRQDILRLLGQANPQNTGCFALAMLVNKQWLMFWENTSGQIIGVPIIVNAVFIPFTIK